MASLHVIGLYSKLSPTALTRRVSEERASPSLTRRVSAESTGPVKPFSGSSGCAALLN
jgi:hypothetical protein